MILKKLFFLALSVICSFHITSAYDHVCDFNEDRPLTFPKNQKDNLSKTCKLQPSLMDKVIIKCGSNSLKYKLNPPNCLQEVYDSNTLVNKKKIHEILEGVSSIMIRNNPEVDVNDVSLRIPPNIFADKKIFCTCEHEKTIRVRRNQVESSKVIKYTGIIEIVIPTLKEKIPGCDFTKETSSLFTNGYDHTVDINDDDDNKITCKIPLKKNMLVGFKCPKDSNIKPEDCFINGYNTNGKIQNLQQTFGFTELVMDHYNNVFYAKFPDNLKKEASFFCFCSYNEKKFVTYFFFGNVNNQNITIPELPDKNLKSNISYSVKIAASIFFMYFVSFLITL
ncbi:6-cysteine protein, putative [Plasmodium gallinaceum]|uniref:6-cysteine protein, putative n=1 Tax=Plasmodium gallinaceum TaxID=5849 RepID=A0A1J1GRP6_PLAGA|nr:6-cysteine protein, putative [Plasmodium gallinaceum]CRG93706.1 6-cysteine protein, putative [Plasmodium gallinaceum]